MGEEVLVAHHATWHAAAIIDNKCDGRQPGRNNQNIYAYVVRCC